MDKISYIQYKKSIRYDCMNRLNLLKRFLTFLKGRDKKPDLHEYFDLYAKGKLKEAYTVLLDIIEKYPKFRNIGVLYLQRADLELLINEDAQKALEFLNKAHKSGFSNSIMDQYYNCYGRALFTIGEGKKAIEYLEKSVELDPTGSNLKNFGICLSYFDDKRAISIWKKVLEEKPNNCLALIYLAREELKSGNKGKAILGLKRVETLNPGNREYFEIGRLYHDMEEYQLALNAYLQSDKLGDIPKGTTYASIAYCYFMIDEDDLAQKYLQWAEQFNPENDYVQQIAKEFKDSHLT
jgi:tetratricopeptide (TPR) repeat protein